MGYRLDRNASIRGPLGRWRAGGGAVELASKVLAFARSKGAKTPIFQVVAEGLFGHRTPEELVSALMAGPIVDGK